MKLVKCKFEKDVFGLYLTPLIGFSNVHGNKSVWLGWFSWLITIQFMSGVKKESEEHDGLQYTRNSR